MTNAQLNRDIKKLHQAMHIHYDTYTAANGKEYFDKVENEFKEEFLRLYDADNAIEYMTAQSIRIMLRLNIRHRFVQFHQFGLMIDL